MFPIRRFQEISHSLEKAHVEKHLWLIYLSVAVRSLQIDLHMPDLNKIRAVVYRVTISLWRGFLEQFDRYLLQAW